MARLHVEQRTVLAQIARRENRVVIGRNVPIKRYFDIVKIFSAGIKTDRRKEKTGEAFLTHGKANVRRVKHGYIHDIQPHMARDAVVLLRVNFDLGARYRPNVAARFTAGKTAVFQGEEAVPKF